MINIIIIINVYGPNKDYVSFFDKFEAFIRENEDKDIINGGDFNTILNNEIDKKNERTDTHKKCRLKLNSLINSYNLTDV